MACRGVGAALACVLLGPGCGEADALFLTSPPAEGLGALLYVIDDGDRPRAFGSHSSAEAVRIATTASEEFTIHALAFACDSLEALGFERSGEEWTVPTNARIRWPDLTFSAQGTAESVSPWTPSVFDPEQVGVPLAPATPCFEFDLEPLPIPGTRVVSIRKSGASADVVILGSDGELFVLDALGELHEVSTPTTSEAELFASDGGELWLFRDARLWHAPIADLKEDTATWIEEPQNPFFVDCRGQSLDIDGGPPEAPSELFVHNQLRGVARFDTQERGWTEIIPNSPALPPVRPGALGDCLERRTDLLWRGPGRFVVAQETADRVLNVGPTGSAILSTTDERFGSPQSLGYSPEFGVLVGTSANRVLRLNDEEDAFESLVQLSTFFELFDLRTILPIGPGRIMWTGDGGIRVYDREYGLCETRAAPDTVDVRHIVQPDRSRSAFIANMIGSLGRLEVIDDVCAAPVP